MELNEREQRDGMRWLYGAGAFAVLLTVFLSYVDDGLTNSKREERLGQTLRTLRTAQTTLASGTVDQRQLLPARVYSESAGSKEVHFPQGKVDTDVSGQAKAAEHEEKH